MTEVPIPEPKLWKSDVTLELEDLVRNSPKYECQNKFYQRVAKPLAKTHSRSRSYIENREEKRFQAHVLDLKEKYVRLLHDFMPGYVKDTPCITIPLDTQDWLHHAVMATLIKYVTLVHGYKSPVQEPEVDTMKVYTPKPNLFSSSGIPSLQHPLYLK